MSSRQGVIGGRSGSSSSGRPIGGSSRPPAPPPPVLGRNRPARRSRSRSRSPGKGRSDRYDSKNSSSSRERDRRGRKSPTPPRSSHHSSVSLTGSASYRNDLQPVAVTHGSGETSISLISASALSLAMPIVRRILNPDEVKIPRRQLEGSRPIFDRPELREAMLVRMRSGDNDENPDGGKSGAAAAPAPTQRVIAIIREPLPAYSDKRVNDPYSSRLSPKADRLANVPHSHTATSSSSSRIRSPSPRGRRSRSLSRSRSRSISPRVRRPGPSQAYERKKEHMHDGEKFRDRRHLAHDGPSTSTLVLEERERIRRSRSRSPIRVPRERSLRSRSVTPPPMPPEIRKQMLERERDLRSKLSRPVMHRYTKNFDHARDNEGFRGRGGFRGGFRGRGGFTRGFRSREFGRSRGVWEHDMFDKERERDESSSAASSSSAAKK